MARPKKNTFIKTELELHFSVNTFSINRFLFALFMMCQLCINILVDAKCFFSSVVLRPNASYSFQSKSIFIIFIKRFNRNIWSQCQIQLVGLILEYSKSIQTKCPLSAESPIRLRLLLFKSCVSEISE